MDNMSHLIGGGSNWGKFDMAQITVKTLEVLHGPDVAASDDGGEGDPDRQALYKQPPTQPNPSDTHRNGWPSPFSLLPSPQDPDIAL